MKALLSAYSCLPNIGSEPGIGWNTVTQLARYHRVWVLTREDSRPRIEAEAARAPINGLEVVYYDLPRWLRWFNSSAWGIQVHYYLWQAGVYFVVKRLHRRVGFDLIHHVTFGRYWSPSYAALLPVPFLWGPVGGGESTPKAFRSTFGMRGRLYETTRDLVRKIGELDYFVGRTARASTLALATTHETATRLRTLKAREIDVQGNCGISKREIEVLRSLPRVPESPVRFISIGRFLHWKGFHLGLQGFARAKLEGAEYWIVGWGPERQRLESLARRLGVAHHVRFWSLLPQEQVWEKLGRCHVLVHPSFHDSGGSVCLEAMGAGRPVICLSLGGPATQVTVETGFKIEAHTPEQVISDLAQAMLRLAGDAELRASMGRAGQRRVAEHYDWDRKGRYFADLYDEVVRKHRGSPAFKPDMTHANSQRS